MESTPVIGVDMRNERVAPLLAPDFLMEVAKGMTPQEQTGRGIPNNTELPKCFEKGCDFHLKPFYPNITILL
jgi:hypothetical protein